MTSLFKLLPSENLNFSKLAQWRKGGINNRDGFLHVTNQRILFCHRHWLKTMLTGGIFDVVVISKKIRFEKPVENLKSVSEKKWMGLKKIYTLKFHDSDEILVLSFLQDDEFLTSAEKM